MPVSALPTVGVLLRPVWHPADTDALTGFAAALHAEPRFFGPSACPKAPAEMIDRLVGLGGLVPMGAFVEQRLVGLARLYWPGRGEADLLVAVMAPWRRAGIATSLVRGVLGTDEAASATTVRIHTNRKNKAALGLGRACGFEPVDLTPGRVVLTTGPNQARAGGASTSSSSDTEFMQ
jgi:GNAT superfamily N-acetyltransferase